MSSLHTAVMLEESMLVLDIQPGGSYIDGTLGGGGHTRAILDRSAPGGRVWSLDVDIEALTRAREVFAAYGSRWQGVEANFRHLSAEMRGRGVDAVDGILLDLGLSSDEIADASKGLSFRSDGPLDMRLGPRANDDGLTAGVIVNTWPKRELTQMIRVFGEERFALRIADAFVKARRVHPIARTLELAEVIREALPAGYEQGRIHPATRTFQALRIAVNDEVPALKDALAGAHEMLRPGGRLAVITFHSIEDRIVKRAFQASGWQALQKKPLTSSAEEIQHNPRARSAKLRVAINTSEVEK